MRRMYITSVTIAADVYKQSYERRITYNQLYNRRMPYETLGLYTPTAYKTLRSYAVGVPRQISFVRINFRTGQVEGHACSLRVWLQSGTFTYAHAYIGTMRCSVATFLTFPQTSSRVRPRTRRPCPCRLHRWEQSARGTMRWPSRGPASHARPPVSL